MKLHEVYVHYVQSKAVQMYICDNCAPVVTRKVRGNVCPWITDEIKGLMRERDYLHNKAIKSSILNDWKAYRVVWNKVNNRICLAKESYMYYESQLSENKNNPKPRVYGKC